MKNFLLSFCMLFPFFIMAQECDCESNFNWLKNTMEKNDAGFSYAMESKGKAAYDSWVTGLNQKMRDIDTKEACLALFQEYLSFIRSGHLNIQMMDDQNQQPTSEETSDDVIRQQFANWERLEVDLDEFKRYLASKSEADYEGIWQSGSYRIGVKKQGEDYVGFIIEADGVYWTKGQIKFRIRQDRSCSYYMRDHSEETFNDTERFGDNYIKTGFIYLNRVTPIDDLDPKYDRFMKSARAKQAYFEQLDKTTTYLRIPTFRGPSKKQIDSVILANKHTILNTSKLIIDIRDNGGGSDRSYYELLPILYTNPLRSIGVEYYSSELNNQRMLDFINDPKYAMGASDKIWAQESYDELSKQLGEFVNLNDEVVSVTTYDTIYPYPNEIAILINENNGSTAEQFLLSAKQSKKVKLFGTTTTGVLDVSNMYFVPSPCEEYMLGYSLSRSMRIPDMTIDDKGIQPDYFIDKSIPTYEWIEHASNVLNGK